MQELSQALSGSENQKAMLLSEARGLKIAARDACAYAEVARDELTAAQADLDVAKKQLNVVREQARTQAEDSAAVCGALGEQLAASEAARAKAAAERDEAHRRMEGAAQTRRLDDNSSSNEVVSTVHVECGCTHADRVYAEPSPCNLIARHAPH